MADPREHAVSIRPILVVDDERSMREMLCILLRKQGHDVFTAENGGQALDMLAQGHRFRLVITDLKMPGSVSGLDVLERVKELDPACQVLVMTAYATPETAKAAILSGAYDYLIKPFRVDDANIVINRALEKYDLLSENLYLKEALEHHAGYGEMIGKSAPMQRVFELIARVAPTKTTILITGESGTGKELAARAIHRSSPNADGPFVPINCGAIPENLIESELFGYQKGAFTGAVSDKAGLFEAAQDGTVFLDEIGELPLPTQVKLLRVLQEKKIKRVGDHREVAINCRIVAATNVDLKTAVDEGRFREDLYYRLNIIPIDLPPLRQRPDDIKLLIEHFLRLYNRETGQNITGVDAQAMQLLLDYPYPGNIRELQNIIERGVTLASGPLITVDVLPPYIHKQDSFEQVISMLAGGDDGIELDALVERLERHLLERALDRCNGVKTEAARWLGISFRAFRYRLDKYEMEVD